MITKAGAEYLLTKYAKLFSISKEDKRYILIHNISQALHAVSDGTKSNPSIDELIHDLGKVEFRHQFFNVLDEQIKDQFIYLVDDLLDDNLEIKATLTLHSPQAQQNRRNEGVLDSIMAGEQFKITLERFLQLPYSENKKNLIDASSTLYKSVVSEQGFDTDRIIAKLDKILKSLLKDIHINAHQKILLEILIKDLGKAAAVIQKSEKVITIKIANGNEKGKDINAFHALNLAANNYLIPNFKKNTLKEIAQNFLDELEKLGKASTLIGQKILEGSFFFYGEDAKNIYERKRIIENIFKSFSDKIIKSVNKEKISLKDNKQQLFDFIDELSEKECNAVINTLMDNIKQITAQDRGLLNTHSINDKWIFNWFMKLIQVIEEAFDIKTTSEELLEGIDSKVEGFLH
ncbi:hypothetical protein FOLKNPGA_02104 [Legionella sp. PC1000]|uniref:hypothetical protein n=1 Tax=Legionella sp. PC1000 TaxID=2746060 RepID=UPI0015FD0AFD|nr:hypothetical protein [Legionella sp. PC1000]QLZ69322.1 hypothetical protein FOLKNPGA_02104 [Legionella sp. PC1000]